MTSRLGTMALIARSYLAAHGVSRRGLMGYLVAWGVVAFASRGRHSALGLQLGDPGSEPLDTIGLVMMAVPALILLRCLPLYTVELGLGRSRGAQPSWAWWTATLGLVAALTPVVMGPLLAPTVDGDAFRSVWLLIVGVALLSRLVMPPAWSSMLVVGVLMTFSAPGVVPWRLNLLYNLELLPEVTWPLSVATLGLALVLTALTPGRERCS
ncbi:hypothetical protein [Nocardioides limicola]|uniref:hypothetical protein n=1 Tax=Nocardioides limicola TaxID=2803368 RepID=UPI00193C844C|nr:hypothetical protein [Nocardioides sp. DJM-14]